MTKIIKRLSALSGAMSMFSFVTLLTDSSGIFMEGIKMLTIGMSIFMSIYTYIFIKNKLEDLW